MKDLYTRLESEELREDEGIFTIGDDIAESFYYGNFSQGVKQLKEINCNDKDLLEYMQSEADNYGIHLDELLNGHFTYEFWIALRGEF